jgi:hypothetical protein
MKTCQKCGHMDLHWVQVDGKWRLHTIGGQLHICRTAKSVLIKKEPKDFWSPEAYLLKPKPFDGPPTDAAYNYRHAWWNFIEGEPPQHMRKKKGPEQTVFEGLVP